MNHSMKSEVLNGTPLSFCGKLKSKKTKSEFYWKLEWKLYTKCLVFVFILGEKLNILVHFLFYVLNFHEPNGVYNFNKYVGYKHTLKKPELVDYFRVYNISVFK